MVSGSAAGIYSSVGFRARTHRFEVRVEQPVAVENISGADVYIAADAVANAHPNGCSGDPPTDLEKGVNLDLSTYLIVLPLARLPADTAAKLGAELARPMARPEGATGRRARCARAIGSIVGGSREIGAPAVLQDPNGHSPKSSSN